MVKDKTDNLRIGEKNKPEQFTYSIIDSIPTALLITGNNNEVLLFNNTFIQLWQIPEEIVKTIDSEKLFTFLDTKLEHDTFFKTTINYLKNNPFEAKFSDVVHKKRDNY